ncbi:hypothetical protein [Pseudomonas sp.]|uniref:hypothetical protein n=1 Tax=Pseudomonas sp. TaxID=306 RepID=UPI002590827F|nr:hypothetical protein [Pseudomonas sp.]
MLKLLDPYRWLIAALLLAAAVAGGATAWKSHKNGLIEQGRAEVRAEYQAAENAAQRESLREIARLTTVNKEIQDELNAIEAQAVGLERARSAALRLRDKAQRNAAIAAASTGALREHAARAEDDLERSDADVERFGLEAVRASAAAHALSATLQARRDAIDRQRETLRNPTGVQP